MHQLPARLLISTLIATLILTLAQAPPLGAAAGHRMSTGDRCYDARAGKRKTSLGVHQWTVRLRTHWCVAVREGRDVIVSVDRETRVRTGTNWRLVSRSGGVEQDSPRRASAESRFHFRLRYPYFEQNCYPRVAIELWASGAFERSVRAGCGGSRSS